MLRTILSGLAVSFATLSAMPVQAGLISMHFNGAVSGYFSLPILQNNFPVGTPLSMDLVYDDSFVGRPASQFFLGMAPSILGTMVLDGNQYTLTEMRLSYFGYGATADDPSPNYGFHVTGTGPATDDGEVFSGLDLGFFGGGQGRPFLVGFGNTNWQVANNGYLRVSGTTTHERLPSPVPAPGTLALMVAAWGAWGLMRRTGRPATA